jgi:SAM-dependent methyltransferase
VLAVGGDPAELARVFRERAGCEVLSAGFDERVFPFPPQRFDVVLLVDVLHVRDSDALVREARRVAADSGKVLALEPSADGFRDGVVSALAHLWRQRRDRVKRDAHFRTAAGWQALFQAAGFYVDWTVCLGRKNGSRLAPNSILYVLSKSGVSIPVLKS